MRYLFYSAFELRCGVEARLHEYLHPHAFVPDTKKVDWRVGKLHKTAQESFQLEDKVARLVVRGRARGPVLTVLYYTPVTTRLKQIAEQLGAHLHAGNYHAVGDPYWDHIRTLIAEGIKLLAESTTGTLLGPLIRHKASNETSLPIELVPDPNGVFVNPLVSLPSKSAVISVSYHDDLPAALSDPV